MFARLWWKDARQFGPAWGLIALSSGIGFVLVDRLSPEADARVQLCFAIAFMGSCLYALAISTAAFAGERENRTLRLLDSMATPRGMLWDGKSSFCIVTALALMLVLFGGASAWFGPGGIVPPVGPAAGAVGVGPALIWMGCLMVEAVGWGLFWSSLLNHVLAAAVLAVCCLMGALPLFHSTGFESTDLARSAPWRLLIGLASAWASRLIFLRSGPPIRSWWPARSPRIRTRTRTTLPKKPKAAEEIATSPGERLAPGWPRAARSLAWQATREARAAFPFLLLLGVGLPGFIALGTWVSDRSTEDASLLMVWNLLVALLAGVGVFNAEQRGQSFRMLAHHGVRPAFLWPIKVLAWLLGLAAIGVLCLGLLSISLFAHRSNSVASSSELIMYGIVLSYCFAVGLLSGMAIRRGITAAMVAVLTVCASAAAFGLLGAAGLLSGWWVATPPVALLAVSWAWTGPWLLDRPGPGKWLRLLGLLGLMAVVELPLYAGLRAWGVPDGGPIPDEFLARLDGSPIPSGEDAAPLYAEAARDLTPMWRAILPEDPGEGMGMGAVMGEPPPGMAVDLDQVFEPPQKVIPQVIQLGWDPEAEAPPAWLEKNAGVLDLIRRAITLPRARFGSVEGLTLVNRGGNYVAGDVPPLYPLAQLVALSARQKQHEGDLDGAWSDVLVLFRMSRQRVDPMTAAMATDLLGIESTALGLAMAWAMDDSQTPELLRKAGDDLAGLAAPPDPMLVIAVEQRVAEQTLDLPRSTLRDELTSSYLANSARPDLTAGAWASAVTTPWEISRARRAFRALFDEARAEEVQGVPAMGEGGPMTRMEEALILASTPLVQWLAPSISTLKQLDQRNEVARRALPQILALRAWQLSHDGRLPDRLEDLVPSELDRLPDDPHRPGVPFQYVPTDELPRGGGTWLNEWYALGEWDVGQADAPTNPGGRLLYSVGPDRIDSNGAISPYSQPTFTGDVVFPIPDAVGARPQP
jgi:hypothetical protein